MVKDVEDFKDFRIKEVLDIQYSIFKQEDYDKMTRDHK